MTDSPTSKPLVNRLAEALRWAMKHYRHDDNCGSSSFGSDGSRSCGCGKTQDRKRIEALFTDAEWTAIYSGVLADEPSGEPDDPVQRAAVACALKHADEHRYNESSDALALKRLAEEVRRLRREAEDRSQYVSYLELRLAEPPLQGAALARSANGGLSPGEFIAVQAPASAPPPPAGQTCSRCYGSGTIEVPDEAGPNAHPMDVNCPACGGTGATVPPTGGLSCSSCREWMAANAPGGWIDNLRNLLNTVLAHEKHGLVQFADNGSAANLLVQIKKMHALTKPAAPIVGVVAGSNLEQQIRSAKAEIATWPPNVRIAMGLPAEKPARLVAKSEDTSYYDGGVAGETSGGDR